MEARLVLLPVVVFNKLVAIWKYFLLLWKHEYFPQMNEYFLKHYQVFKVFQIFLHFYDLILVIYYSSQSIFRVQLTLTFAYCLEGQISLWYTVDVICWILWICLVLQLGIHRIFLIRHGRNSLGYNVRG